MGVPIIFSGNNAKTLKPNIDLFGNVTINSGAVDPTSVATFANAGSIYLNNSTGLVYRKTDNGSTTNWVALGSANAYDINTTNFSAANNVSSPANVTGLAFSNSVSYAKIYISVVVNATSTLGEGFELQYMHKSPSNNFLSVTSVGDNSGFVFTVTAGNQIQYTNNNYAGFINAPLQFRAITVGI
jgi:hypothetical protein